jgi:hypothetical protein
MKSKTKSTIVSIVPYTNTLNKMHLIYINEIGSDYKGQKQYEFIFSETFEIDMGDWFQIPASATQRSKSPDVEYVNLVGLLKNTDLKLELVQDSDYFGVIDAVDGVVSMAWEKFDFDNEFERLTFKFGESVESVNKKLKGRGYILLNEEIKNEE